MINVLFIYFSGKFDKCVFNYIPLSTNQTPKSTTTTKASYLVQESNFLRMSRTARMPDNKQINKRKKEMKKIRKKQR